MQSNTEIKYVFMKQKMMYGGLYLPKIKKIEWSIVYGLASLMYTYIKPTVLLVFCLCKHTKPCQADSTSADSVSFLTLFSFLCFDKSKI